jgi:hypothetical protein
MAKKLVLGYELDTTTDSVILPGNIFPEKLQLITDVEGGVILYNFADSTSGYVSRSFSEATEKTTFVLDQDLSSYSNTAPLQIFIDTDNDINFEDELLDPVNKIRVSNPENLIDTDFEYGLQSTKWETLELSGNIPSFYASGTDGGLRGINKLTSIIGSDVITCKFNEPHQLQVGSPILVQGLSSQTAEGKYLIRSVASNTEFTYISKQPQSQSVTISGPYTTIDPGQFYVGSELTYNSNTGMQSDLTSNSIVTITTPEAHGFKENSSFYLVNTIAPKKLRLTANTSSTAPDGRPYIDAADTLTEVYSANTSLTETKQMRGMYYKKITSDNVDVTNNKILWDGHSLKNGDCLLYVPSNGDSPIGGLEGMQVYFVRDVVTGESFKLTLTDTYNSTSQGSPITFTDAGTYNYGRGQFILSYRLSRMYTRSYSYYTEMYSKNDTYNVGSGWDRRDSTYYDASKGGYVGLMGGRPEYIVYATRSSSFNVYARSVLYYPWTQSGGYMNNSNQILGINSAYDGNNLASSWNFVEDIHRYSTYGYNWEVANRQNDTWLNNMYTHYNAGQRRSGNYNYYAYSGYWFAIPLTTDEEADTLFFPGANFNTGDSIQLPATSNFKYRNVTSTANYSTNFSEVAITSGGTFDTEAITPQRIKVNHQGGHSRISSLKESSFDVTGVFQNSTKNSYYVENHGISPSDQAIITADNGGEIPSVNTGDIELDSQTNFITATNILENYVSDFLSGYSGAGTPCKTILDGANFYYPIRYNNSSDSTNYVLSSNYLRLQSFSVNWPGVTGTRSLSTTSYNWNTGEVEDPFQGDNVLGGKGFAIKTSTAWERNKEVDFYSWTTAIPKDSFMNYFHYTYTYRRSGQTNRAKSRANIAGTNWYYEGYYQIFYYGGTYMIYMKMRYWNEDWQSGTNNFSYSTGNPNRIYGNGEDYLEYNVVFQKNGSNWTVAEMDGLIEGMGTALSTGFAAPNLTAGQSVKFDIINGNRFRTTNLSGSVHDLATKPANTGIQNINFLLEGGAGFGVLDGSYNIKDVPTENSFRIQLPFEAPEKEISFNANTDVSNNINSIYKSLGHNLAPGTPVKYTTPTGEAAITGLVNNQIYYTFVHDDKYLSLSANTDSVSSGEYIELTSAQGIHTISANVINGLVPAVGNVSISGTKVSGTETLFKRFYKSGDTFFYIDNSTTPGSLQDGVVASITDDSELFLTVDAAAEANNSKSMIPTALYTRPDGSFQHRPFDGGVEITAGSSPDSQIIRQTRKYFRYQSGKGIQVSLAINFNPPRPFESLTSIGNVATGTTKYPHGIANGSTINVNGSEITDYNGTFDVTEVPDNFTLKYQTPSDLPSSISSGFPEYNITGWDNSAIRAGLFDDQNGLFFEYDGSVLYCVRRSSTQQLPGTVTVNSGSNIIAGNSTQFNGQVASGDKVVIRGMTYKVVKVSNNTSMTVQPAYRGISSSGVIVTKTIDTRVGQDNWNEDVCDGTGKSGFILDINKIQMAYIDYSWYGAGKVRFGFKTRKGRVNYVHSFLHNNRLTEAYMRSGNVPARYEIENQGQISYVPSLFHWGTSVIMDGTFDDDKAYLFTGSSDTLTFTNGESNSATTNATSQLKRVYNRNKRTYEWFVELSFSTNDASKFSIGTKLYTADETLNGQEVYSAFYSGGNYKVRIYITDGFYTPPSSSYPSVGSGTAVNIGAPASGGDDTATLQNQIPLISIRLAASVDNGISGTLGARDIINRMQLQLAESGVIVSEDSNVSLILNGNLSNLNFEDVTSPSLSNLVRHNSGDNVIGGKIIYQFRAAGGTSTTQDLSQITDLGNSILGGDEVFPNGPDLITVAVQPIDTSNISATNPYTASARITWTESQA